MSVKIVNKKNKSRTYLLPLLMSRLELNMSYIGNTYLYKEDNFDNYFLHIEHSFNNLEEKEKYDNLLSLNIINIEQFSEGKYLYTFKIDNDFKDTYRKFVEGKYSKIANVDKNLILSFWQNQKNSKKFTVLIKDIFDRSSILKKKLEEDLKVKLADDAELSSIIDLEKEIFYDGY